MCAAMNGTLHNTTRRETQVKLYKVMAIAVLIDGHSIMFIEDGLKQQK
jgi:hypothetical protein